MRYVKLLLTNFGVPNNYVEPIAMITTLLFLVLFLYLTWYLSTYLSKKLLDSKLFKLKRIWNYALKEANVFAVIGYIIAGFIANIIECFVFPIE